MEWRKAAADRGAGGGCPAHAHVQGVVHRDVKPANVMLLESGEPKVMDFGIAKVPAERLTSTGQFFGTPSYMSPEQASAEVLDGRSDLFSLAAVLHLLLTGRTAFEGDSVPATLSGILFRDPAPVSSLVPGLPPALDHVLAKALAKRPSDRYADARAFGQDLEALLAGRAPAASQSAPAAQSTQAVPSTRCLAPPLAPRARGATRRISRSRCARRRPRARARGFPKARAPAGPRGAWRSDPPGRDPLHVRRFRPRTSVPVELNFEHPLRSGVLKVFVDDDLVLEEALDSWVKEDLLVMKVRKGRVNKSFDVPAGDRVLRLEVEGEGYRGSRTLEGRFEAGEARRLEARLGGLVKKDLSAWLAPRKDS